MRLASSICLALLVGFGPTATRAKDMILEPEGKPYTFKEDLRGSGKKEDAAAAYDVSGIACILRASGKRRCLVVNDEGRKAQFLTIDDRSIDPKKTIDLIGKAPDPATRGTVFAGKQCPDKGPAKFKEFDGEGVAYAKPYFYAVGSHGCGRRKDTLNTSSMILARIRVDDEGKPDVEDDDRPEAAVETTYRLGEVLAGADRVGASFLESLSEANGLNIEGIAVVKDRLYAGLRAPSIAGEAFLVEADLDALFAEGHGPYQGKRRTIPIKVGKDAGIRDLAVLEDGRLLVLTGPAQEQPKVAYKLFLFDPARGGDPQLLGELDELDDAERAGKPEAVTAIGPDRVLVLFDSLRNGGPRAYKLPVKLMPGE
ncbi:hypothetical protein MPPM_5236 [Methylorubrum populi]|uniref:DUF3616 domain-containing protein n=1 Tax=Methylorubrum populi TaxID=223967 RepID=A0A160PMX4_9HYPH|nr:DUF3616 domain-containing protein [Methylorubrum populi]BAU93841.1 hypothetical protein MPPM_5236 [Methylorubrum populi]